MPWKINKFGEPRYIVSIYTKEELPTWGEVYYDFYKNGIIFYDPNNKEHQTLDLYWKIPKRKYILSIVCNQFNKMLFEDGLRNKIIEFFKDSDIVDFRFSIQSIKSFKNIDKAAEKFNMETDIAPPIYTVPLPTGKKNPFIVNDFTRININDIKEFLSLYLWVVIKNDDESKLLELSPLSEDKNQLLYDKIMKYILAVYIEYFEGDGVGWKDENGNIIENEIKDNNSCNGVGYDPAL